MLCFGQAPGFLHGKGNFLVIRHPGVAVNWLAPLPRFFRLPDAQDNIPTDSAILANHWSWADNSLQQSVPQADNFVNSRYDVHLLADGIVAPGSQNGFDISGRRGPTKWQQAGTADRKLVAIQGLIDRYAQAGGVLIEALHLFFTANLTIIEVPAKRLVARMPILNRKAD